MYIWAIDEVPISMHPQRQLLPVWFPGHKLENKIQWIRTCSAMNMNMLACRIAHFWTNHISPYDFWGVKHMYITFIPSYVG